MRKSILILGLIFLSLPSFAERTGQRKDYYSKVTCPNGSTITVEGICCEPGSTFTCFYTSCSNYTPPTVTCPSIGD
jgi:hypothetical protein